MKMPLVLFTKLLHKLTIEELIQLAHRSGIEGYDLCCRPRHLVNPDNVTTALPKAAKQLRSAGLVLPMLTSVGDLLEPTHPTAEPILGAMQ